MNFEAADVLRQKINAATKGFVGFNDPSLVSLVPHAQFPGNAQLQELTRGTLIVKRGSNGEIIGTGIVESGERALRRKPGLVGVTRLGLIDDSRSGRFAEWRKEVVSSPTADELIALLTPRA